MTIRIGINGFGRIGRLVYRAAAMTGDFEIIAINDLVPADNLAYLLQYDTMHGRFAKNVEVTGDGFDVEGMQTKCLSERDPSALPWGDLGVDYVLECTGKFNSKDKLLSFVTQELGWDKNDVEDMWPDLLESQPDDQSDEDVPDDRGNYHGVEEGSTFANKLRGPAKEVFQKALAQIKKEKIKRSDEKKRNDIIDGIDGARHINDRDMRDIKRAMTYESHDDFKDDSDVDDYEGNYSGVNEEAPPGMEDVVKKLKADGNSDEEAFKIMRSAKDVF